MSILALTSNTLIGTAAAGNIEYDGQFFGTDSNASRAQLQRIVRATAVSASGTSVDFTGIPAWVKRVTVMFTGVSHNGSTAANDQLIIQIGSGSITSSGYVSICVGTSATTGFLLTNSISGAATFSGVSVISLIGSNTYAQFGNLSGNGTCQYGAGSVALGGALDRVRITTVGGTDTFDAGTINILYEG